jgi:hypothetical protein
LVVVPAYFSYKRKKERWKISQPPTATVHPTPRRGDPWVAAGAGGANVCVWAHVYKTYLRARLLLADDTVLASAEAVTCVCTLK